MSTIGLGTDIVSLERMKGVLARQPRFLMKVFTENEQVYCAPKGEAKVSAVAGHFAAKEAISKALGSGIGEIGWKDIEVSHLPSGKPLVILHKKAKEQAELLGVKQIHISISHEREFAVAVAILED